MNPSVFLCACGLELTLFGLLKFLLEFLNLLSQVAFLIPRKFKGKHSCWLYLTSMGPLLHDPGTLVPIGTSEVGIGTSVAGLLVAADFSPYFASLWVVFACLYMLFIVGDPDNYMTL
jgi:uncharacterized membrane protein YphA (DoxX/SURF4 family)